jgi:hypothetical protein
VTSAPGDKYEELVHEIVRRLASRAEVETTNIERNVRVSGRVPSTGRHDEIGLGLTAIDLGWRLTTLGCSPLDDISLLQTQGEPECSRWQWSGWSASALHNRCWSILPGSRQAPARSRQSPDHSRKGQASPSARGGIDRRTRLRSMLRRSALRLALQIAPSAVVGRLGLPTASLLKPCSAVRRRPEKLFGADYQCCALTD